MGAPRSFSRYRQALPTDGGAPWLSSLPNLLLLLLLPLLVGASVVQAMPLYPPHVMAEAAFLLELRTGRVLYEKNADEVIPPASLVKLMTLYLAYDALETGTVKLRDQVKVTHRASTTPRYRMGLWTGELVSVETLIKGMTITSANDAATALAEHLAGSVENFVEQMNTKAGEMGLSHTHFANPHGLPDPGQVSTAADLAELTRRLLLDHPGAKRYLVAKEFRHRGRAFKRVFPLFSDPGGVQALKTGYTDASRFNLAVAAIRGGRRILCVVLGADTRGASFSDAGALLRFGFSVAARTPTLAALPVRQ